MSPATTTPAPPAAPTPPTVAASGRLILVVCIAHILSMQGFAGFAALLPSLAPLWSLSKTEAGWIGGILFVGYAAAVPVLVTLTDRMDARRIYLFSCALAAAGFLGFGLFARGFASAMVWHTVCGAGIAGTYMPGLKALTDRLQGRSTSRATAFYTASFGIGTSLSFVTTAAIAALWGWRAAFLMGAVGSLAAAGIVAAVLRPMPAPRSSVGWRQLVDIRPVLRNRVVMACAVAYTVHNLELFALRGWVVAFLDFSRALQPAGAFTMEPTIVASIVVLLGLPASVGGNEIGMRLGKHRWVAGIMAASLLLSLAIGWLASASWFLLLPALFVYGVTVTGDSAAMTSRLIEAADPRAKGATMAFYSSIGFVGSFLGPLVFGLVLDAVGPQGRGGWAAAFSTCGLVLLPGILAMLALGRPASGGGARPAGS